MLRALGAPLRSLARPCIRRTQAKACCSATSQDPREVPSFECVECVDDPLLGGGHAGGSAVRRRRRKEAETLQTLVASVQVLTKALADLQSSFARMGGKLPPSATAVVPLKPKAKRKPKGNKPRAPESPNVPPLLRLHDRSLPLTLSRPWCVPALRTSLLLLLPCLLGLPPKFGTVASAP